MKLGDIILVPFPFTDFSTKKLRPAVVIGLTDDKYKDVIVSAISSVVSHKLSKSEILLRPTSVNKLRATSIIKVDRIVTLKSADIVGRLGKLSSSEIENFRMQFKELVD